MRFTMSMAALAVFSLPVYSQQNDSVVVTATRFADAKRNLAVGVSVISADELNDEFGGKAGAWDKSTIRYNEEIAEYAE